MLGQKEDVFFNTECGQRWKLHFEKREYKAYVFTHGGWKMISLGGCDVESLRNYIERTYRKEVR